MPVLDGRGFRAVQRADPAIEAIPVIVLTAEVDASSIASELWAVAGLRKPVRLDSLLALIREHAVA
jgi:CheY-like chemotaxis protein